MSFVEICKDGDRTSTGKVVYVDRTCFGIGPLKKVVAVGRPRLRLALFLFDSC